MEFLDIFNEDIAEVKIETKINKDDRKRNLDQSMLSFIDRAADMEIKKPKLAYENFSNPLDNLSLKVVTTVGCVHEVVYPTNSPYVPLKPKPAVPAKEFPFTLDPFQVQALLCTENNQSVLVSAHTSAGKTVCASYAIALSIKEKKRIIYTTPIKALSNQKYRDFKEEFEDVGLLTGDVTIDANASILIMTTEILRLMLYRNSSILKEVGWIIYDEIHYMRDKCRGVVWEESIILLPPGMRTMFLSATIPNARQFAQWISYLQNQPCNVIYTDYRPTPLQHYIYPNGSDRIYQVVNERGEFMDTYFNEAMASLRKIGDKKESNVKAVGKKDGGTKAESHCETLIKKIFELKKDPVIVFSFSKKGCEKYAKSLSKLDYTSKDEKQTIEEIFTNARNTLPEEDKKMQQLDVMLNLVKRGIGIHHGGLLPVLKEIVEILFGEGLIKCLFATETFSMGLNMPAKTVIFTAAHKFDGINIRLLTSGEYIQMSGRAGRRGLDTNGNVILMLDKTIKSEDAKQVIKGETEPLNSSFHLTYNMILNLMRNGELDPEYLMKQSFLQFQTFAALPKLVKNFENKRKELMKIDMSKDETKSIKSYHQLECNLLNTREEMWSVVKNDEKYKSFIVPGRLVHIKHNDVDFGWCIIMTKLMEGKFKSQFAECLVPVSHESIFAKELSMATPPRKDEIIPDALLLSVRVKYFLELSSVVVQKAKEVLNTMRTNNEARKEYLNKRSNIISKFQLIPLLDVRKEIKCNPKLFEEFEYKLKKFEKDLNKHPIHLNPQLNERIRIFHKKSEIEAEMEILQAELDKKMALIKMDELKSRKRILRNLKFCSDSDVIETKGRVACEISTSDELMLTELMLSGDLSSMNEEQLVAYLSCFVFDEFVKEIIQPQKDIADNIEKMRELARHISRVSKECRLTVMPALDEDLYADSFKKGLVEIVRAWAKGSTFSKLCDNTDIYEGSIIRTIRRLDELLGQLLEAARVIGNIEMEKKFSSASNLIKRGIIFASSLYLANQ